MTESPTSQETPPPGLQKLREEHGRLRAMLDIFERELDVFEADENPDYEILSDSIAWCRDYINACHHPKEDALLEKLRARDPEGAAACTDLSGQHAGLGESTQEVVRLFEAAAGDSVLLREDLVRAGRAMAADCRTHLDWEERHFFPRLAESLTETDWAQVAARFADTADALAAPSVDERYRTLFAAIDERMAEDAATAG